MKLNPDCVRDLLIYLEENLGVTVHGFSSVSRLDVFKDFREKYSYAELLYSLIQLHESGYIITDYKPDFERSTFCLQYVFFITPKGHDLLASIYSKEDWKQKVSPILKSIGSISLSVIESVSKGVTEACLSKASLPPSGSP